MSSSLNPLKLALNPTPDCCGVVGGSGKLVLLLSTPASVPGGLFETSERSVTFGIAVSVVPS